MEQLSGFLLWEPWMLVNPLAECWHILLVRWTYRPAGGTKWPFSRWAGFILLALWMLGADITLRSYTDCAIPQCPLLANINTCTATICAPKKRGVVELAEQEEVHSARPHSLIDIQYLASTAQKHESTQRHPPIPTPELQAYCSLLLSFSPSLPSLCLFLSLAPPLP